MDLDFLLGLQLGVPIRTLAENDGEKGLKNSLGENNCFLNVVIQSLWHLDPFRKKFTNPEFKKHLHQQNCVYCSLEIIFTQYQFSEEAVLPPTVLREAMAILYKSSTKFQLYELDDAAEAFESVLDCLHKQKNEDSRSPNQTPINTECENISCVSHKVFGIGITEQIHCDTCGAATEPTRSILYTFYAYVAALRNSFDEHPEFSFGSLLHKAAEERRCCPNTDCTSLCYIRHRLRSLPEVLTINVVWGSDMPSLTEIASVLSMMSLQLDMSEVFDLKHKDESTRRKHLYRLRGMICYYGKHYTAFFHNFSTRKWYVFDDTNVKAVGSDWSLVQQRCLRGRLHPSVLFYEREEIIDFQFVDQSLIGSHVNLSKMNTPESPVDDQTSVIKISRVRRPDIETQLQLSILEEEEKEKKVEPPAPVKEGSPSDESSFVFIGSDDDIDQTKEIDFEVQRTNWLYRKQGRIFRFTKTCFMRVMPQTGAVKEQFDYKDVLNISLLNSTNLIIKFRSEKPTQYLQSDHAQDIIEVIKTVSQSGHGHTFPIHIYN